MDEQMLFDTDVLIWLQRGNERAADLIEKTESRFISVQSYMELLRMAKDKRQHKLIKSFLGDFSFSVLPLTEKIGYRAAVYIEEYSLTSGLRAGDAIIAATAVENSLTLSSGDKHMSAISELDLKHFRV